MKSVKEKWGVKYIKEFFHTPAHFWAYVKPFLQNMTKIFYDYPVGSPIGQ